MTDIAYLSLRIVRLALRQPAYPDMFCAAMTQRGYWHALCADGTRIYGAIVAFAPCHDYRGAARMGCRRY